MKTVTSGNYVFEVVESVPVGYKIWNIGKNMIDGYLPLCKLKEQQPFEGGRSIEVDTLKAIKIDGAQTILVAIGGGQDTIKSMERYIKRYSNSNKRYTQMKVNRMKKALEVMHQIKWDIE